MEPFSPQIICIVIASRDSGQDDSRGLGETNWVKRKGKVNESSSERMGNTGCTKLACGTEHRNRSTQSWTLDGEDQVQSKVHGLFSLGGVDEAERDDPTSS